jgi:hypothetical protein
MSEPFIAIIMKKFLFTILVVSLFSGCCCTSNKKAGIACIQCQPEDIQKQIGDTATFSVKVDEKNCRFEWFRVDFQSGLIKHSSVNGNPSAKTSTLTLPNLKSADEGYYFCSIMHENAGEQGDVLTRTRDAYLRVVGLETIQIKQLSAPQPRLLNLTNGGGGPIIELSTKVMASTGPAGGLNCGSTSPNNPYTISVTYLYDDATGTRLRSPSTASSCTLHVDQIVGGVATALPNTKWMARWQTATNPNLYSCIGSSGTNDRAFSGVTPNTNYTFVIYFVDPQTVGATYRLTVSWT